jgi:hypothetical protein
MGPLAAAGASTAARHQDGRYGHSQPKLHESNVDHPTCIRGREGEVKYHTASLACLDATTSGSQRSIAPPFNNESCAAYSHAERKKDLG